MLYLHEILIFILRTSKIKTVNFDKKKNLWAISAAFQHKIIKLFFKNTATHIKKEKNKIQIYCKFITVTLYLNEMMDRM